MLPLSEHPTNAGRSPMKLYEYLAAGLRVVARRTPALAAVPLADVALYGPPVAGAGESPSTDPDTPAAAGRAYAHAHAKAPSGDGRVAAREMDWSFRAALVLDQAREMTDPARSVGRVGQPAG